MAQATAQSVARQLLGFGSLPLQRQLSILVGLGVVVALVVTLVTWGTQPTFQAVLPGMSERDKAEAIDLLTRAGIAHHLDTSTGAVMVPDSKVHEARLQLATGGLPREHGVGFELLDRDGGFGTSRMIENTRYQRALEGELARSVTTLDNVESARVHLALPRQSAFVRDRVRPSASVLVNLRPGRSIDDVQVAAIIHLVASSVAELEPERVTVVDQRGRLLSHPDDVASGVPGPQLDYTRRVEESIRKRVQDLLAPLVGEGGMRVQVAAEIDFTQVESTRETYDGDKRALRSEQVSEDENRSGVAAGVPGALSNQPPGPAVVAQQSAPGNGQGTATGTQANGAKAAATAETAAVADAPPQSRSSQATRNFEVDRTIEHTKQAPGSLRRLSVAVVVDDRETVNEKGEAVRSPRDAAEIEHLTSLVREAVGYDEARGDRVSLINASFVVAEPVVSADPVAMWEEAWFRDLVKQGLAALGVLALILFVLRPALTKLAAGAPAGGFQMATPAGGFVEVANDNVTIAPRPGPSSEERLLQARSLAKEDPRLVAHVVKQWMDKDE